MRADVDAVTSSSSLRGSSREGGTRRVQRCCSAEWNLNKRKSQKSNKLLSRSRSIFRNVEHFVVTFSNQVSNQRMHRRNIFEFSQILPDRGREVSKYSSKSLPILMV